MNKEQALIAFEQHSIRRFFDEADERWYFSVIDVVAALTDSVNPRDYWFKMKIRVGTEDGFELSTICRQLKMKAPDGKMRETDCAHVEGLFRIIQSIPSPKAEPFKQWLAKVGYERMQDMADPARALDRARAYWQQHGRSEKWIQQRMMGQETRNKLTDYWKDHERRIRHPDQYHPPGMVGPDGTGSQAHQRIEDPEPARPHERSGTDFHRAGRTLHPPNRREREGHRHARKCRGGQAGRWNRKESAPGPGAEDRKKGGESRKLFATPGEEKDPTMKPEKTDNRP